MKASFGISEDKLTPNELLKAFWNHRLICCGLAVLAPIYVPQPKQMGLSVAGNDAIRITGKECQAKVIGEGANLGNPPTRIEYAQNGGRLNTGTVDNSAGVDCSDHEVNIKILLSAVQQKTGMSDADRNKLLESMTDEVGELCLVDNYEQTDV